MELHECKKSRGDDIYRWHNENSLYTQILNEKTTPSLKELGRRGIFQQ